MKILWANSLDLASVAFEFEHGRAPRARDLVLNKDRYLFAIFNCDFWTMSTAEFIAKKESPNCRVEKFGQMGKPKGGEEE